MDDARPVIRAIIARDLGWGYVTRTWVVPLSLAYLAVRSGRYICVGPDPEDTETLATWEREHAAINRPRWHR